MSNSQNMMTCQKRRPEQEIERIEKIGQCTSSVKSSSHNIANGSTSYPSTTTTTTTTTTSTSFTTNTTSTTSTTTSTKTNNSTDKRFRKFSQTTDKVVDTRRLDFDLVTSKLLSHLKEKNVEYKEIITDLILDSLKNERYPDPKVIQCDLDDIGLCTREKNRSLLRFLWDLLSGKSCDRSQHHQLANQSSYYSSSSSSSAHHHQSRSRDRDKYDRYSTSTSTSGSSSSNNHHSYATSSSSHSRSMSFSPTNNYKASSSMHH